MKYRKQVGVILAAAMALSQMAAVPAFAEEVIAEEDEVIADEEMEITIDEGTGGDDVASFEEGPDVVAEDQEGLSFDQLIEDGGMEVVTVSDGADYQEVLTAESEADAAAEKVRELMDGVPLLLESADRDRISTYLEEMTKVPSPIGSDGELEVGAYIEEKMRSFGYTVSKQNFHEGFLNRDYVDVPGVNIIAERGANGRLTDRTQEIILIGCHYDSKTEPDEDDPLANDKNAAAAVLECARILSTVDSNVDLCFLFFSGEEDGYFGSERLVEGLSEEIRQRIKCMIYVGPVGYVMKEEAPDQAQEDAGAASEAETAAAGMESADASVVAEAETQAGAEASGENEEPDPTETLPILVSAPTKESSDPADLLRALGLYRKAEDMLTGDILLSAGTDAGSEAGTAGNGSGETLQAASGDAARAETALAGFEKHAFTPAQWEEYAARREAFLTAHQAAEPGADPAILMQAGQNGQQENAGQAEGSEGSADPEAENEALAQENLEMLQGLEDWTQVAAGDKYLLNFSDNGIAAAGIFQPVDTACTLRTLVQPIKGLSETAAEESTEAVPAGAGGESEKTSISSAVGAEAVSNILLQAGADGQDASSQEEVRVIPVADAGEIAETADFLASAISLYMRSQSSISLE